MARRLPANQPAKPPTSKPATPTYKSARFSSDIRVLVKTFEERCSDAIELKRTPQNGEELILHAGVGHRNIAAGTKEPGGRTQIRIGSVLAYDAPSSLTIRRT